MYLVLKKSNEKEDKAKMSHSKGVKVKNKNATNLQINCSWSCLQLVFKNLHYTATIHAIPNVVSLCCYKNFHFSKMALHTVSS